MERIGEVIKLMGTPQEILGKMTQESTNEESTDTLFSDCEYCQGAGFVHPMRDNKVDYGNVIPCRCRQQESNENRRMALLRACQFPPMVADMTFNNFKAYPAVQRALIISKVIANNPGKLAWLTLMGLNGVGKTHLAVAICKSWADAGIPSRYVFVPLLLDELREGFSKTDNASYQARFNFYCTIPLLLLDDLGTESKTAWVQEKLETLVDYRLMNKLSLIVTCNKALDELSPRIASRLTRLPESLLINVDAPDYMVEKAKGK